MADRIKWKCPKCGEVNDMIIGLAPAIITIDGALEEGGKFESWTDENLNNLSDVTQFDKTTWLCPNCESEFPGLISDHDIEEFIKDNRIQLELQEGG